jgi:hypothetical protein
MKLGTRARWLPAKSSAVGTLEPLADSNTGLPHELDKVTFTTLPTGPDEGTTERVGTTGAAADEAAGTADTKRPRGRSIVTRERRTFGANRPTR